MSERGGGHWSRDLRMPVGNRPPNFSKHFPGFLLLACDSLTVVNHKQAIRKRDRLVAQLPSAAEILRGSLLERTIRHRSGCPKCARGEGHQVFVLSVGYPGEGMRQISLRREQAAHVKQCLENYYRLKAALEEICELNQQLIRLEPRTAEGGQKD